MTSARNCVAPYIACFAIYSAIGFLTSSDLVAYGHGIPMCVGEVENEIRQINAESDETIQADLAARLAQYFNDHPSCGRHRVAVDKLIKLLRSKNDAVRWGAAEALGHVGSPAKIALPALEQAMRESDAALDKRNDIMLPTQYSGQAARDAIRSITGRSVPDYGSQQ